MLRFINSYYHGKCLLIVTTALICLLLLISTANTGEKNEKSFISFLDNLSDEEPRDRYAIFSGFAPRDDLTFIVSGFRARLTRRLNVIGGLRGTIFADERDLDFLGWDLAAHEDLIVRSNGRIYLETHYTLYQLAARSEWSGGTVHEFGIGCGFSQGFTFFYRVRYYFQAIWNFTGKGEWTRTAEDGGLPLEKTTDFTGYYIQGGAVILL